MLTYKQKLAFIARIAPLAQASQSKYGVPASITIAQAIKESAWGQSPLALRANNFFGIKVRTRQSYAEFDSTRFRQAHGARGELNRFRKFRSAAQCFDTHARLLASIPKYQAVMKHMGDPVLFASLLQRTYAKSPDYAIDLVRDIGDFELEKYDKREVA